MARAGSGVDIPFIDDGSLLGLGHDPVSPAAERFGDTVGSLSTPSGATVR